MSRKDSILAALALSYQLGYRQNSYNLERRVGLKNIELQAKAGEFIPHGLSMIDIAIDTTMATPSKAVEKLFTAFGQFYGDFISNNDELPDTVRCLDVLVDYMMPLFSDDITHDQATQLRTKLVKYAKDHSDE